jgi:putative ABC transport system ATP-binding protein
LAVLKEVDLKIAGGALCVMIGPSGAGKTTLLNILGGLDRCDQGQVLVDGSDLSKMNQRQLGVYCRAKVGFVFQAYNLVPNLTALENVQLATQLVSEPADARRMLESVGLGARLHNFPAQLSGGEQQRVAIARALAKNPALLLCDEPTGALDAATGVEILELIQQLNKDSGVTVVLITHNPAITGIADQVVRMRDGRVAEVAHNQEPMSAGDLEL